MSPEGYRTPPGREQEEGQMTDVFRRAGEILLERELEPQEIRTLTETFQQGEGTPYERAMRAIRRVLNVEQIRSRGASSDNTDRAVRDLRDVLERLN